MAKINPLLVLTLGTILIYLILFIYSLIDSYSALQLSISELLFAAFAMFYMGGFLGIGILWLTTIIIIFAKPEQKLLFKNEMKLMFVNFIEYLSKPSTFVLLVANLLFILYSIFNKITLTELISICFIEVMITTLFVYLKIAQMKKESYVAIILGTLNLTFKTAFTYFFIIIFCGLIILGKRELVFTNIMDLIIWVIPPTIVLFISHLISFLIYKNVKLAFEEMDERITIRSIPLILLSFGGVLLTGLFPIIILLYIKTFIDLGSHNIAHRKGN